MNVQSRTGFAIGAEVIRAQLRTMPNGPGVYRMLDAKDKVLYVGKAKSLKKRVAAYTQQARLPNRLQRMVAATRGMEIVTTRTEAEALLLEASLIQRFMPPYNILFRDDKSYPYIVITRDHDFPQLLKHRGSRARKGWYYGPFASSGAVDETITLLHRAFMLRNCSNPFFETRTRPCLQYHIKRCTAPCVGKVTPKAYAQQVEEARDFLNGKTGDVQKKIAEAMQKASEAMDYERAAALRDRIRVLTSVQARQDIHVKGVRDADVIAAYQEAGCAAFQVFFYRAGRNYGTRSLFLTYENHVPMNELMAAFLAQFYAGKPVPPALFLSHLPVDEPLLAKALGDVQISVPRRGERRNLVMHALQNARTALRRKMAESAEQTKLFKRIADVFGLPEPPTRIEVYDNSHISGTYPVGAMIAAGPEGFLKKTYRKFNIRDAIGGDDVGMMNEVFSRRFRRLIDEDPERRSGLWPNLILIDGGQGQLNAARQALAELGVADVAVVAIAKGPDRNAGHERFFAANRISFTLPPEDPLLYYLQRLRDEAHRFAIGTHRTRRAKAISQSGLEDVPGIGALRKKALLHHFGSAKAVQGASSEDLARAPGISASLAKKIHDYFHSEE